MYHTLAWTEDLVTATLTDLDVVSDDIISVVNSHFMPASDMNVYAGVAYGTNLQRARVTTPRLRQVSPIFLRPHQPTLIGGSDANNFLFDKAPLRFRGQEEITIEAIQNAGVNQRITVVMFLGLGLAPVPAGDVFVVRATSSTAATANAWSSLTYTLDQSLPAGRYAVCLIEHISTNSQAVRMIFDNQYFRPGVPGLVADGNRLGNFWYTYPLGILGYFLTYSQPRIQVLCNGADATHVLYLHLIPMPG